LNTPFKLSHKSKTAFPNPEVLGKFPLYTIFILSGEFPVSKCGALFLPVPYAAKQAKSSAFVREGCEVTVLGGHG
jgi:hypothetical protein